MVISKPNRTSLWIIRVDAKTVPQKVFSVTEDISVIANLIISFNKNVQ